ncbi:DUF6923 family protein, partial [Chelativorans xinjiangense]|uniref:DUF6923 family protein n=1 Tax=Chelativorans xinjiangense TaxID=2681485 RepID=UPI0013581F54
MSNDTSRAASAAYNWLPPARGFRRALAAAFPLAAVLLAGGQARAQVMVPFDSCDESMYLAQNAPTGLFRFETSTNPFVVDPQGPASQQLLYNSIAMHPTNHFLYGQMFQDENGDVPPAGTMVRVDKNGRVQNIGVPTGLPTSNPSGEIGPDGTYYTVGTENGEQRLYRVNLTTMTATSVKLSEPVVSFDLAWHNERLYVAGSELQAIDPTNGTVTTLGATGIAPGIENAFGGMFGSTNGIFGSNNSGGFYRFDLGGVSPGFATLISELPASGSNDGAKCVTTPLNFPADVTVEKTSGDGAYVPGEEVSYTIEVSNPQPFGAVGVKVRDPLPVGITQSNWTCTAIGGAACGNPSGTGAIDETINMPVNGLITYQVTMQVPIDYAANQTPELANTFTAENPPDIPDPNEENNTSTVIKKLARLEIEKTGEWVDENRDGVANKDEPIEYTIIVKNTGEVPIFNIAVQDSLLKSLDGEVPNPLDPGGSATLTGTYLLSQADIDSGSVTNSAIATGETEGGTPVEDTSDDSTNPKDEDSDGDGDPD